MSCTTITPYHLALRMAAAGVKEVPGAKTNWLIAAMNWMTLGSANEDDPWCGSMLHFTHWLLGFQSPKNPAGARNWLQVGDVVSERDVRKGDVVILWRESRAGWKGHVGYFDRWEGDHVRLLGGNQSDGVTLSSFDRSRILGIRRPQMDAAVTKAIAALTPSRSGGTEV